MLTALGLADGHYLSVEEVDPRKPGPHDIVVRVGASGVCHTDVAVPATCRCHCPSSSATRAPETGSEVTSVAVGDRVIGTVGAVCGTCWYCVRDMTHLCDNSMAMTSAPRVKRTDGTEVPAFVGLGTSAKAMTVHEASVVPVTTDLPDEQLALIGCPSPPAWGRCSTRLR
jgi:S-(hydroxymethyl)glutathione dehydrogenase/alcohol dehydrogenase